MHIRLIDGNSVGLALIGSGDVQADAVPQAQAVEGFLRHVRRWRQSERESLHVVLWDGNPQWRRDLVPGYLGDNLGSDQSQLLRREFEANQPLISQALCTVPVIQVTHPDMEAADLAYALSHELSNQGHLVELYTPKQAWQQCVRNRVRWMNSRKRENVIEEFTFRKETGYANSKAFVEAAALSGDDSVGLPAAPGFTEARAREVISQYGSLSAFWKATDDPFFQGQKYLIQAGLPATRERIRQNKLLMDLSAAPLPDVTRAVIKNGEFVDIELYEILKDLGIADLIDTFELFCRPFAIDLSKEQTSLFRRAVANMARAYPQTEFAV